MMTKRNIDRIFWYRMSAILFTLAFIKSIILEPIWPVLNQLSPSPFAWGGFIILVTTTAIEWGRIRKQERKIKKMLDRAEKTGKGGEGNRV